MKRRYIPPTGDIAYPRLKGFEDFQITFEPTSIFRPHEKIFKKRVEEIKERIEAAGYFHKAILADKKSKTILDGHHKWQAAQELGLVRIPVILADYQKDKRIRLERWESSKIKRISKKMVVAMGKSKKVFPPKTTRHILSGQAPAIRVPLDELGRFKKKKNK